MKFLKNNLYWIIILILAAIPLIIWATMLPLSFRFGDVTTAFESLGQIAGLTGMALFAINLILSARLKFFDYWFRGLNRVYIQHHRIGAIAFILLLFHPIFLTIQYLTFSLTAAMLFLLPSNNWAVNFGELALLGMIVLLVLTFFVSLRYDFWKKTHKFLGLAFFFGGLHVFFITSDISVNLTLRWYMLTLATLGMLAYIYHTLLGRITTKKYLYNVDEVKNLNEAVVEIVLSPFQKNEKISYTAGQFAFINFNDKSIGLEEHPFSFISEPHTKTVKFAIKNSGDYTSTLPRLHKGTIAKIEGPYGQFSFTNFFNKNPTYYFTS